MEQDLTKLLDWADQTIGCLSCGRGWWAEHNTDDPTLFHEATCPLFGRRDAAAGWFNLPLIESELGRTVGATSIEEWKALTERHVLGEKAARNDHHQFVHKLFTRLGGSDAAFWNMSDTQREEWIAERVSVTLGEQSDDPPTPR